MKSPAISSENSLSMLQNALFNLSEPRELSGFRATLAVMLGQYLSKGEESGHSQNELDILQSALRIIDPNKESVMQSAAGLDVGDAQLLGSEEIASTSEQSGITGSQASPRSGPSVSSTESRMTFTPSPSGKRARAEYESEDEEYSFPPLKRRRPSDNYYISPRTETAYFWEDVFEKGGASQLRDFVSWCRSAQGEAHRAARQDILYDMERMQAPVAIRHVVSAYQLQALSDSAIGHKGLRGMDLAVFHALYEKALAEAMDENSRLRQQCEEAGLEPLAGKTWQSFLNDQLIRHAEGINVAKNPRAKKLAAARRRLTIILARAAKFHVVERAVGRGVFVLLPHTIAPRFLDTKGDQLSKVLQNLTTWMPKTRILCDHIAEKILNRFLRWEEVETLRLEETDVALDRVGLDRLMWFAQEVEIL